MAWLAVRFSGSCCIDGFGDCFFGADFCGAYISRLELHLIPTHPDRAAGLMFFGYGQISFAIVVFAAGTIVSAQIGEQIIWQSAELSSYKTLIVGYVGLCVALILAPLFVFSTKLWAAKLQGLRE